MKARTVAWLSAIGIALSSAIGWSLSERHPATIDDDRPTTTSSAPAEFRARAAGLELEARLGHPVLAAERSSVSYLYASVRADSDGAGRTRAPLDVAIVVDRSGSMRGKRLANALSAARGVIGRLSSSDVVSVIAYNGSATVLVPPTPLDGFARDRMTRVFSELEAQGSTCISCAIDTAVDTLRGRSSNVSRIVLLSDGEATDGVLDVAGFRRLGETARHAGIAISTIGVDVDYNERIMSALAEESNGHHYFVADASGLPAVFDQEFQALTRIVADDVTLEVELMPGVERLEVLDRASEQVGRRVRIPLGTLAAGEHKSALVRVRVEGRASGRGDIASIALHFRDLERGSRRIDGVLSALFTRDREQLSDLDPFVAERLTRSETAAALTEANRLFAAGDAESARRKITAGLGAMSDRQKTAVAAAPKARAREVSSGFSAQEAVLQSAAKGFGSVPAGAAPNQSREGRTQVRRNQAAAFDVSR
jgi:Ca-activated chloride channel family protein